MRPEVNVLPFIYSTRTVNNADVLCRSILALLIPNNITIFTITT